ncbi:MAG: hypothetical protein ACK55Z_16250, partial [bacterium]
MACCTLVRMRSSGLPIRAEQCKDRRQLRAPNAAGRALRVGQHGGGLEAMYALVLRKRNCPVGHPPPPRPVDARRQPVRRALRVSQRPASEEGAVDAD